MVIRNVGVLPQHYTASQSKELELKGMGILFGCVIGNFGYFVRLFQMQMILFYCCTATRTAESDIIFLDLY